MIQGLAAAAGEASCDPRRGDGVGDRRQSHTICEPRYTQTAAGDVGVNWGSEPREAIRAVPKQGFRLLRRM
jgi:hypothetical protein